MLMQFIKRQEEILREAQEGTERGSQLSCALKAGTRTQCEGTAMEKVHGLSTVEV